MCGRYYVDEIVGKVIRELVHMGDIHPSELAEIICPGQGKEEIRTMRWGFPGKEGGLIINARAETVLERPFFRESARYRRCVVPARRYYEWNPLKEKVTFERRDTPVLYMAGLYNLYQEEERFVVITTEANESVRAVHDRMPLILEKYEAELWLKEEKAAQKLLGKIPGAMQRTQEYEQLSLWSMEE